MMSETNKIGLSDAALRLGVPVRVLRHAMRRGSIAAPGPVSATMTVSPEWVDGVMATAEASPKALGWGASRKVPEYARYKGTSAWHKFRARGREYARFLAAAKASGG